MFRRRVLQSAKSWEGCGVQSERKSSLSDSSEPMGAPTGQDCPQKENSPGEHVAIRPVVTNFGVRKLIMSAVGTPSQAVPGSK